MVLLMAGSLGIVTATEPDRSLEFRADVEPILTEFCYDCHADGMDKGGVSFDELESETGLAGEPDLWLRVIKNLRAGLMPPQKKSRPSSEQQGQIENWVKYSVFGIDPTDPDPGRVTIRRLNRAEYRNTIRDLMGVDFRADEEFPPDDTGYGFDNIGDVLTMSPLLMEKYMQAAETIVDEAVPTVSKVVSGFTIQGQQFRGSGEFPDDNPEGRNLGVRPARGENALNISYYTPAKIGYEVNSDRDGDYRLVLNLSVRGDFDSDPGRCVLVFSVDDREVWRREFKWEDRKKFSYELAEEWQAGGHRLTFELQPLTPTEERRTSVDMQIVSVEVQGPMAREHWVHPPDYERYFFEDEPPVTNEERREYAREVLRRFARKAFRRPADDRTLEGLVAIAEEGYRQPDMNFEQGVARAMVAVLASPRFLFRVEETDPTEDGSPFVPLDDYSLASRLSYFLWSTMPDDELSRLADEGELRKKLEAQVKRMLKDDRSREFVENFTGQWLQVRDVDAVQIDARIVLARDNGEEKELKREQEEFRARLAEFRAQVERDRANQQAQVNSEQSERPADTPRLRRPRFRRRAPPEVELDRSLREAMRKETEMYFAHVMREDRSVLELLDSDYTFVNERLAKLYGIPDVTGRQMRRVSLPDDSPRGGVITHGSVLVVTSNPTRTSPVKRGLFVLDNILGMPPPPPPADVPALEDSEEEFADHEPTLREVLELHRRSPLCSSCHTRMDPLGLALENFNALSMWREEERNQTIEASGTLITGESFQDVRELKRVLVENRRADFYRCLTEKMLIYALGRGLEYYDVESVDQIVARLEEEDGRFSALLMGIVESAPMQKRRSESSLASTEASGAVERIAQH